MDAAYLADYEALYRRHWWWRARERLLLRELEILTTAAPVRTILDVGCGNGLFFRALRRFGEPSGVEPALAVLDAAGPFRARIHAGPFDRSYSPATPFDLLLALDVIEHVADPDDFLETARRTLRPGGIVVATVPALRALWTAHDDLNEHLRRFTRREFATLFERHGFTVVHARYFFVLLAFAKLAVRAIARLHRPGAHAPRVPMAFVNALLHGVCLAEQFLLGRHAPEFGSSLLLIARAPGE